MRTRHWPRFPFSLPARFRSLRRALFVDVPGRYPVRGVLWSMVGMFALLVAGSTLIEAAFRWREARESDPRWSQFAATCYWAGDVRNYARIAVDGYSRYPTSLETPHFTDLNESSWWPLFPALSRLAIETVDSGYCATRTVNGLAFVLLIPVFAALTAERRVWRLLILGLLPHGAWLYVGQAETFFLLVSALLVWVVSRAEQHPFSAGLAALPVGVVVGLAKPNALALIPALGLWGALLAWQHARIPSPPEDKRAWPRVRWRHVFANDNPGLAAILGGLGIALGMTWWFWQTSGFYPFYVLLQQRTLWWREFEPGSPASFARLFTDILRQTRSGFFTMTHLQRLAELTGVLFGLALALSRLPPYWNPREPREQIALSPVWRVGVLSVLVLMLTSGQTHGVDRYMLSNVFAVLIFYRLLFGAPDQRVIWRPWTLPGLMRWTWLLLALTLWGIAFTQLGWRPLD